MITNNFLSLIIHFALTILIENRITLNCFDLIGISVIGMTPHATVLFIIKIDDIDNSGVDIINVKKYLSSRYHNICIFSAFMEKKQPSRVSTLVMSALSYLIITPVECEAARYFKFVLKIF